MDGGRRQVLKSGSGMTLLALLAAAGWLRPGEALAESWNKAAFDARSLADAMSAIGGGGAAQSKDVEFFQTPEIAENGAVVPIGVASKLPKTESIAILIEKNPNMLASWQQSVRSCSQSPRCRTPCANWRGFRSPHGLAFSVCGYTFRWLLPAMSSALPTPRLLSTRLESNGLGSASEYILWCASALRFCFRHWQAASAES